MPLRMATSLPVGVDSIDTARQVGEIAHNLLHDPLHIYNSPGLYPLNNDLALNELLIAQGIPPPADRIETVSGAFGRVFVAQSDAVWFISAGVVAREIEDGRLISLPVDTALTAGPVGLMVRAAHTFGLTVVAEGVERPDQLARVRDARCDHAQGYLFHRPLQVDFTLAAAS